MALALAGLEAAGTAKEDPLSQNKTATHGGEVLRRPPFLFAEILGVL
jgi:hypothetical protein